ncbi:MAG TPA: formate dehydrogenase accessory sulfurtransferase FdhD [Actinomycetota bacterium]|jgi:FdhD protein
MLEPAPLRRTVTATRVLAVRDRDGFEQPDRLATEEPMEIRAEGPGHAPVSIAVTMRTPGHDFELAVGFLCTEGLIHSRDDVASVVYCDLPPGEQQFNVVTVRLARPFDPESVKRNFYTTSSCGVCGKASLEQVQLSCTPVASGPSVPASVIAGLPGALRETQRIFEQTGGLHASGLFTPDGEVLSVREDVGRHNAVDKLVGEALLGGDLPLSERILMVSGRVSFEIVQKAAMAGVPMICAVSAPSSLAVESARELGMTVVGFVRGSSFNVYTGPERVQMGG